MKILAAALLFVLSPLSTGPAARAAAPAPLAALRGDDDKDDDKDDDDDEEDEEELRVAGRAELARVGPGAA